jgi:hypothetical protein
LGPFQNHQSFHGASFSWRELLKCFAGDEQRQGAQRNADAARRNRVAK